MGLSEFEFDRDATIDAKTGNDLTGRSGMTDQRHSKSLNRFLMRRAMHNVKYPPVSVKSRLLTRWSFKCRKRSLKIRAGVFGLEIFCGGLAPVPNNVSVDAETFGFNFYLLPLSITPGQTVPGFSLVKRIHFQDCTEE